MRTKIAQFDPNYVDVPHYRRTALHLAVMAGDVNRVKWLVENGAKVVKDDYGQYPHELTNPSLRNDANYQRNRLLCAATPEYQRELAGQEAKTEKRSSAPATKPSATSAQAPVVTKKIAKEAKTLFYYYLIALDRKTKSNCFKNLMENKYGIYEYIDWLREKGEGYNYIKNRIKCIIRDMGQKEHLQQALIAFTNNRSNKSARVFASSEPSSLDIMMRGIVCAPFPKKNAGACKPTQPQPTTRTSNVITVKHLPPLTCLRHPGKDAKPSNTGMFKQVQQHTNRPSGGITVTPRTSQPKFIEPTRPVIQQTPPRQAVVEQDPCSISAFVDAGLKGGYDAVDLLGMIPHNAPNKPITASSRNRLAKSASFFNGIRRGNDEEHPGLEMAGAYGAGALKGLVEQAKKCQESKPQKSFPK